jgi:hypothetical protein
MLDKIMFKFISIKNITFSVVDSNFIEIINQGATYLSYESAIDKIIYIYEKRELNVCANLILLLKYIIKYENWNYIDKKLLDFIKNKYPSYYDGLEKYLVLI